ncbi:MAG: hypothetical protein AAF543_21980 [Pseudomonadota bacterium]
MTIALIGNDQDLATNYLDWLASQRGIETIKLTESGLGSSWSFDLDEGGGEIFLERETVASADLTGALVRFTPEPDLPPALELEADERSFFIGERREALHQFVSLLPCPVANPTSAGRSNSSKPYQMMHLSRRGFRVPDWVASNDADAVRLFVDRHPGGAVYKSISGLRSQVRELDDELLQRLTEGSCPVIVQQLIRGREVRIHTVGDKIFPTEIRCPAVDYRFNSDGATYGVTEVPDAIARRCVDVARQEGLLIAGFDFLVDEEENWWVLEYNPVPSFLPYEMSTGQEIGAALLDELS